MPTSPESPTPSLATTAPAAIDPQLPGALEQLRRFEPMAHALAAADVRVARIDPQLIVRNAAIGVAALHDHRDEIATLPGIALDAIDSLADMGLALQYASGQVERFEPMTGEVKVLLARATKARNVGLVKADVAVVEGIIPASVVAGIRRGRGSVDTAGDCIALAAMFHQYKAQLDGHVKITDAEIQEMNDSGVALLNALRPPHAPRVPIKELQAAADLRDRIWTLFERTWTHHVWRPGAWLFGRDVAKHVPPLSSRDLGPRAPKPVPEPPAPTPAPTPTPTPVPAPVT